jgi:Na+/H+ antiporter NhaD/arsenite permease-like protein
VALLIPASRQLEQTRRIPAREVLLPIAHVTTLAGSVTLIGTSPNRVIAGIAGERGVDMGMFSFAAVALPVAGIAAIWRTPLFRNVGRAALRRQRQRRRTRLAPRLRA